MLDQTSEQAPATQKTQAYPSVSECPYHSISTEFSPFSDPQRTNPYPFYARARKDEPVFFSSLLNMWVVTRYDDVHEILKDHKRFSFAGATEAAVRYTPETREILRSGIPFSSLQKEKADPEEHARVRGSVNKAFTPRRIAELEPRVRQFGNQLIDEFIHDGHTDLVSQFSSPHPFMVIASVMGIPAETMNKARIWVKDFLQLFFGNVTGERQAACARSLVAFQRYLSDLIEQRRTDPQEDLISDLVQSIDAGRTTIYKSEMVQILCGLVIAGLDTTTNLISSCVYQLLAKREYWQAIQKEPNLIPQVVEEALRFDAPSIGIFRTTTEEVTIGGVTIPAQARLYVLSGSSNHDENHFANPEIFDPYRKEADRHHAFGYGVRFCLGAPLVRLEARVALELLSQRLPEMRLVPDQKLIYSPNLILRDLQQLLVEWDVLPISEEKGQTENLG